MAPVCTRVQLITLKVGSKIHIHAMVLRMVGTMKGRSRKARARLRPPKGLVHHQGHGQSAQELEDGGHDRVEEGVAGHLPEHTVVEEGHEVPQPHEEAGLGDLRSCRLR
jgi:hypothetical protein